MQKALRDDIRLRPGGLTLNEAKGFGSFIRSGKRLNAFEVEAYHGSRHDFEGFSNDAIGTGEGAQSFGYGHYVAEARGTAESYRLAGEMTSSHHQKIKMKVLHSMHGRRLMEIAMPLLNC